MCSVGHAGFRGEACLQEHAEQHVCRWAAQQLYPCLPWPAPSAAGQEKDATMEERVPGSQTAVAAPAVCPALPTDEIGKQVTCGSQREGRWAQDAKAVTSLLPRLLPPRYEIDKLTASQRLDLNLEKGRMRDELQASCPGCAACFGCCCCHDESSSWRLDRMLYSVLL